MIKSNSKSNSKSNRRLIAAGMLIGGVFAGSAAWAAWSANGSGNAAAKAGTSQVLTTVDVSASTTASLYPGATGSSMIRITNPNSFPVRVTAVSNSGTITSDKGAACNASTGVSFVDQTGLALDIAAGTSTTFTLANSVTMSNASDNSCQAAVFTIPVTLTGASNG